MRTRGEREIGEAEIEEGGEAVERVEGEEAGEDKRGQVRFKPQLTPLPPIGGRAVMLERITAGAHHHSMELGELLPEGEVGEVGSSCYRLPHLITIERGSEGWRHEVSPLTRPREQAEVGEKAKQVDSKGQ